MSILNKKAKFEYSFLEIEIAGIILNGTEIKSIREGKASISEAYVIIIDTDVIIRNMYIQEYENSGYSKHSPRRDRKLLLTKQQIKKWSKQLEIKGLTIIPYKLFINDSGICKIEISLAKGKRNYDKRETIKQRDIEREKN